ncbi:MAG TPA: alpha-ketoglutarate-dependent dioxygenase AlkB [Actinomycetota bacterium]|nr:alpha-ketoglutarate-dependent dioxygenase AlkB [Actinomycetota bacterium]
MVAAGAALVRGAVDGGFLPTLQAELERLPLRPAPEVVGPVRQETEECELPAPFEGAPAVSALARALTDAVRRDGQGIPGLERWVPTVASVQRYRAGSLGITPHRDGKRFVHLVAVVNVRGRARFSLHDTRSSPPADTWRLEPGDLVLLRGPGLGGLEDGRPFHSVRGPERGVRYSLGLRMEARSGCRPGPGRDPHGSRG